MNTLKNTLNEQEELKHLWSKHAETCLLGRCIVNVRYPNEKENLTGLLLFLDDGTIWEVMRDDEGNGPGALHLSGEWKAVEYEQAARLSDIGGVLPAFY